MRPLLVAAWLTSALVLGACRTPPPPPPPSSGLVTLDFLADGITTREQALQRLGQPSREFTGSTGGEVLTFRIGDDAAGLHVVASADHWYRYDVCYSLVLSFDLQGVLDRHALVKVKGK